MATRTRDTAPLRKEKRGTSPSTTKIKPLVQKQANQIVSNKNIIPNHLKPKVSPVLGNTQGKNLPSLHDPIIHNKQTPTRRQSFDKPPPLSGHANALGNNSSLSNDVNHIHNKPNLNRRRSIDFRPPPPSSTLHNTQGKKLASSSSDSNLHNKQTLARRTSMDYKAALSANLHTTQGKKLVSSSSVPNIHNKQTLTQRSSFDHKPPLSSPLLKNRTSPNPRERSLRPSVSHSSKTSTSQKPLNAKLSKAPHTSKNVIEKNHSPGLYARAVNQHSSAGLTPNTFIPSNMTDIVENIAPKDEVLELVEHQEPVNYETYNKVEEAESGESNLIMEDHQELNDNINIEEYLKAAESSLYLVENQDIIKMEVPEEHILVEETRISDHKELEEIKSEPSKLDAEEIEKQENEIKTIVEDQEETKGEESEIIKASDDCQQEKEEGKEVEIKALDVNTQQEKEENEGRSKGKEVKEVQENKITMAFAKPYPHLLQGNKKESVVSNDVIEETASKLREQRKNRVKALAGAFETVISLQDPRA